MLIPKLEKEKINLCSGWYGAKLLSRSVKDELEEMKQQLQLFKDCNAPCMVFAEVSKLNSKTQINLYQADQFLSMMIGKT